MLRRFALVLVIVGVSVASVPAKPEFRNSNYELENALVEALATRYLESPEQFCDVWLGLLRADGQTVNETAARRLCASFPRLVELNTKARDQDTKAMLLEAAASEASKQHADFMMKGREADRILTDLGSIRDLSVSLASGSLPKVYTFIGGKEDWQQQLKFTDPLDKRIYIYNEDKHGEGEEHLQKTRVELESRARAALDELGYPSENPLTTEAFYGYFGSVVDTRQNAVEQAERDAYMARALADHFAQQLADYRPIVDALLRATVLGDGAGWSQARVEMVLDDDDVEWRARGRVHNESGHRATLHVDIACMNYAGDIIETKSDSESDIPDGKTWRFDIRLPQGTRYFEIILTEAW